MKTRLLDRHSNRPRCARTSEELGFTLVEMMVASVVLSVSMVAVLGSTVTLMSHSRGTDARVGAIQLQQSVIEDIRARANADEDILDYVLPFQMDPDGTMNVASVGDIRFTVQGVIPPVVQGGPPQYFTIPVADGFDRDAVPQALELRVIADVVSGPVDATYVFTGSVYR